MALKLTWPTTRWGRYQTASRASILLGFTLGLAYMVTDGMGWGRWLALVFHILGIGGIAIGLILAAVAGWLRGQAGGS